MKPKMWLCMGMPGAGKTSFSTKFSEHNKVLYLSPDMYYAQINGDEKIRTNKFLVWHTLFGAIHQAEMEKKSIIIDTQGLTYTDRRQFIDWFPDFEHHLVIIAADYELCLENNNSRSRKIPEEQMKKLWDKYDPPNSNEYLEWDTVTEIENIENELTLRGIYIRGEYCEGKIDII